MASTMWICARRTSSTAIISRTAGAVIGSPGGSTSATRKRNVTRLDRRVIFFLPLAQSRQNHLPAHRPPAGYVSRVDRSPQQVFAVRPASRPLVGTSTAARTYRQRRLSEPFAQVISTSRLIGLRSLTMVTIAL